MPRCCSSMYRSDFVTFCLATLLFCASRARGACANCARGDHDDWMSTLHSLDEWHRTRWAQQISIQLRAIQASEAAGRERRNIVHESNGANCSVILMYNSTITGRANVDAARLWFDQTTWQLVNGIQVQSPSASDGMRSVESVDEHQTVDVSDVLRTRQIESNTHWLLRVRLALNNCLNVTYTAPQLKLTVSLSPTVGATRIQRSQRAANEAIDDCDQWANGTLRNASLRVQQEVMPCCRRRVRMSFEQLGWGAWVLAPRHFDAYYCIGRCTRFAAHGVYADFRNVHSDATGSILTPCCAPVSYAPLMVTARRGSDEYVTQALHDIIVEQCGCL